jgi:hypothetical protein
MDAVAPYSKIMDELDLRAHNELIADLYEMGISLENACPMITTVWNSETTWTGLDLDNTCYRSGMGSRSLRVPHQGRYCTCTGYHIHDIKMQTIIAKHSPREWAVEILTVRDAYFERYQINVHW